MLLFVLAQPLEQVTPSVVVQTFSCDSKPDSARGPYEYLFQASDPRPYDCDRSLPEETLAPRPGFSGRLACHGGAGMHALMRHGTIPRDSRSSKITARRTEISQHKSAKESLHNQVNVEEFERQRMGVAAKE